MRYAMFVLGVFLALAKSVSAEGVTAGVSWPGWEVRSGEYYDAPGYPLSWMFDGNPSTAWVFQYDPVYRKVTPTIPKKAHGIGESIHISRGSLGWQRTPVTIDEIGLINGYAKSRSVYLRNNRITRLRVTVCSSDERPSWSKEYTLCETRAMQRLRLPRMTVYGVHLAVLAVTVGKDDDLCISEIALFNRGKQLPWRQPPFLLAKPSGEVIDFMSYYIADRAGKRVDKPEWDKRNFNFFAWQPGSSHVLLAFGEQIFLYDSRTNRIVARHRFPHWISLLGWQDAHTAVISTGELRDKRKVIWYSFATPGYRVQRIHPIAHRHHGWPLSIHGG